ncbi:MAG TPA: hypothetical protein VK969_13445, partial [Acidimicrobiia bacterium]|nr:hypothetical protein [Acidimicrobiia bacterium]
FVALAVILLSAWLFVAKALEVRHEGLIFVWILISGLAGTAGGVLYLLSIDGPGRYRTRALRTAGWAMMLAAMTLPSSLSFFMLPMVALLFPTLVVIPKGDETGPITSS